MKEWLHTSLLRMTLAAAVVVTTGCTNAPDGPKPRQITVEGQDPRILLHDGSGPAMQALLTGHLTYTASSKCLTVRRVEQAEPPVVLIWPPGTLPVIQEGKRGVRLLDEDAPLLEGAEVRIAGGYVDWKAHPPAGITFPDACIVGPAIFKVSPS